MATLRIGKAFFNLINKHFPTHHKLHKICNKFNVKLSYSCMPNMMSIINNHNKKLLHPHTNDKDLPCNCRNLPDCPLNGKCRTKSIIYKASISVSNSPTKHYFGCCETEFKTKASRLPTQWKVPDKIHHLQSIHQCFQLTDPTLFWLLRNRIQDPFL